jgi:hypothetical protein
MKKVGISKIVRILFTLAAFFSIAAGVVFFVSALAIDVVVRLGISGALVLHGIFLFAFGWMIGKTPPRYPRLAAGFVFLSLVAFIFDDLGPVDFAAMGFYLLLFVLCVRVYLSNQWPNR